MGNFSRACYGVRNGDQLAVAPISTPPGTLLGSTRTWQGRDHPLVQRSGRAIAGQSTRQLAHRTFTGAINRSPREGARGQSRQGRCGRSRLPQMVEVRSTATRRSAHTGSLLSASVRAGQLPSFDVINLNGEKPRGTRLRAPRRRLRGRHGRPACRFARLLGD